jgi:hypothetical protein
VSELVVTSNSSSRSADPGKLAELAGAVFGPDRVRAVPRLDDAIEFAVELADAADARSEDGPGLPGGALVLITGSVITAGDARRLLTRAEPGEPSPGPASTGGPARGQGRYEGRDDGPDDGPADRSDDDEDDDEDDQDDEPG